MSNVNNIEELKHQILEMFNTVEKEFSVDDTLDELDHNEFSAGDANSESSGVLSLDHLLNHSVILEGTFTNISAITKIKKGYFLGEFIPKDFNERIKIHFRHTEKISSSSLFDPVNLLNAPISITGFLDKRNNDFILIMNSKSLIKIMGENNDRYIKIPKSPDLKQFTSYLVSSNGDEYGQKTKKKSSMQIGGVLALLGIILTLSIMLINSNIQKNELQEKNDLNEREIEYYERAYLNESNE